MMPSFYREEQVQEGLNNLSLWGSGTRTQVVSANQLGAGTLGVGWTVSLISCAPFIIS